MNSRCEECKRNILDCRCQISVEHIGRSTRQDRISRAEFERRKAYDSGYSDALNRFDICTCGPCAIHTSQTGAEGMKIPEVVEPEPVTPAKVKPLDLSIVLRHAFLSGVVAARNIPPHDEIDGSKLWVEYEPYEPGPFARVQAALERSDPIDRLQTLRNELLVHGFENDREAEQWIDNIIIPTVERWLRKNNV